MKTIGLIATTSVMSAKKYFDGITRTVNHTLGGLHSAKCITCHADFHEIEQALAADQWYRLSTIVVDAAVTLEEAGADFLVLCSNALHKLIPDIRKAVHIPVLHVVDVVSDELVENDIQKVGVLGTKYTMAVDYYQDILTRRGIEVILPSEQDIELVNAIIFEELGRFAVKEKSKQQVLRVIDDLCARGAEGIVLSCTELAMLVQQVDTDIPLFDTAMIHAERAAQLALRD
jgi:aspartate racemase